MTCEASAKDAGAKYSQPAPPIAQATEPLRKQFSAQKAAEFLDAQVHASEKRCFGCHDTYSYLAVRRLLGSPAPVLTDTRRAVEQAVVGPAEAPGTPEKPVLESPTHTVMIAATLADEDAAVGRLRPATKTALARMWQLQRPDGSWNWLKAKEPPSAVDDHFGVTMAILAAGQAPEHYARSAEAQAGLKKCVDYLKAHAPTTMHQQLMLLQAARYRPEVLSAQDRQQTLSKLFAAQRPDGGWTMAGLVDWQRLDGSPQDLEHSDGYATGMAVYTLRMATDTPLADARLQKGLAWLKSQQRESGAWFTRSPRRGDAVTTFAGTAYAIRALAACGAIEK